MAIEFKKTVEKTVVLDPSAGFAPKEVSLETRWDPLTGETSRLFEVQWKGEKPNLREMYRAAIEGFCPFCPDNLERVTPKFPEEFIPEGRLKRGRAVVFPNQRPFDKLAAVVVLGERHFVTLEELDLDVLFEGLLAAQSFLQRASQWDPSLRHFAINWNLLPPAGGSVVHPHLHAVAGGHPTNHVRKVEEASLAYWRAHGRPYWLDLWQEEKKRGERYLGEVEGLPWILTFAPKGYGEVLTLFPGEGSLLQLPEERLGAFVRGLGRLLNFWGDYGVYSFNLVLYGGGREPVEGFWVHARALVRRVIPPAGASDVSAFQTLHDQPIIYTFPEKLRQKMQPYFEAQR